MNYTLFQHYLELVVARGLVELVDEQGRPQLVRLTAKGYEALMFLVRGIEKVVGEDLWTRK